VTTGSTKMIIASVVVGLLGALIWFGAPLVPAMLGALAAGLLLYWRQRRERTAARGPS
jgi:Zn-dependent protease with chaperone function